MEPTATAEFVAPPIATGDIQDFDGVVQRYWPRVLRFLLAAVHDTDLAETLTQDCLLKAYRSHASLGGESSVNTWLMSIAVNLVRDHTRSRRFQFWRKVERTSPDSAWVSEILPDRTISPEQTTLINEQVQAVWSA